MTSASSTTYSCRPQTHRKLRRSVKVVNTQLAAPDLEKHPDKTLIGKIEKGFDFLRYLSRRQGLTVAQKANTKFVGRVS